MDGRFQSISLENLDQLLLRISKLENFSPEEKRLVLEVFKKEHFTPDEITSDWIRTFLLKGGQHPAKKYPDLFLEEPPEAGVTYQWSLGLDNEKGLLSYTRPLKRDLRVWLDVLFIDQLSENVPMNLAKAQEIYCLLPMHLVIPKGFNKKDGSLSLLLSRGWCVFELCLRSIMKRKSIFLGDKRDLGFEGDGYDYAGNMQLTMPEDRKAIEFALALIFGDTGGATEYVADRSKLNPAIVKQIQLGMRDPREFEEHSRAIEEEEKKYAEARTGCTCFSGCTCS